MNNSEKESQRDRIVEIIDKISNEEHLELVERFAGGFLDKEDVSTSMAGTMKGGAVWTN